LQNWLNKPDGGRGWASVFVSQGYTVYIVDQTVRGRSAWEPGNGTFGIDSAEFSERRFTAVQRFNQWPQAKFHTQWPGTGLKGDPIFDAFQATQVQSISSIVYQQSTMQKAGVALLDRIGKPAIVFGHSMGGPMPLLMADKRPQFVRAIFNIEPYGPPFINAVIDTMPARPWGVSDAPITYDPPVKNPSTDLVKRTHPPPSPDLAPCTLQADSPPPKKLVNLQNIPMVIMTTHASYHAGYDYCTVAYVKQAGIKDVTHVELPKVGITGNGHMVFMEKNSDAVAAEVLRHVGSYA
jgi:pimeloyl-ACP methyl ester carboxylesterase